jgi:hypothetical protein
MNSDSQVKLIMNYDVKDELDQEYFEFIVREFVPTTTRMGLQTIGVWYTSYSKDETAPKIRLEALADSLEKMREILNGDEWKRLHDKLMSYVENYNRKVVRFNSGYQI